MTPAGHTAVERATEVVRRASQDRAPHSAPLPDHQVRTLGRWAGAIVAALRSGGTLFTFGNGGSAADAEHLAAELVGRYRDDRRPLAAVALTANTAALTAIANDYGFDQVFARQVHALAGPGDLVLGISTSGRSPNVLAGLAAARDVGAGRLALLGGAVAGEDLDAVADSALVVSPDHTPGVQEAHRLAWHLLCAGIDAVLAEPLGDVTTGSAARVVGLDEAVGRVAGWRAAGHRIATTNGCFDLLHDGHLAALEDARRQADHLVVLCNTDDSVARRKGAGRPVVPFAQRAAVLAGLRAVDLVVPLDDDLPTAALARLAPDVHAKGAEYDLDQLPEAATVVEAGGRIHRGPMVPGRSTTALVARLQAPGPDAPGATP